MRVAGGTGCLVGGCLWMTAPQCTHTLTLDSDLWCVTSFFPSLIQTYLCWKKPSAPCLSSFLTSVFPHSISRVCGLNEKQLVCGVSLRAWLCVRVRPCDEMATALIVWHGAAAAFCQKSSSDSPTGMMAHLTNASPQNGPTIRSNLQKK